MKTSGSASQLMQPTILIASPKAESRGSVHRPLAAAPQPFAGHSFYAPHYGSVDPHYASHTQAQVQARWQAMTIAQEHARMYAQAQAQGSYGQHSTATGAVFSSDVHGTTPWTAVAQEHYQAPTQYVHTLPRPSAQTFPLLPHASLPKSGNRDPFVYVHPSAEILAQIRERALFYVPAYRNLNLRVAQACEACRKRKSKCSGEKPKCKRCERRDIDCVYVEEHRANKLRKDGRTMAQAAQANREEEREAFARLVDQATQLAPRPPVAASRTSSGYSSGSCGYDWPYPMAPLGSDQTAHDRPQEGRSSYVPPAPVVMVDGRPAVYGAGYASAPSTPILGVASLPATANSSHAMNLTPAVTEAQYRSWLSQQAMPPSAQDLNHHYVQHSRQHPLYHPIHYYGHHPVTLPAQQSGKHLVRHPGQHLAEHLLQRPAHHPTPPIQRVSRSDPGRPVQAQEYYSTTQNVIEHAPSHIPQADAKSPKLEQRLAAFMEDTEKLSAIPPALTRDSSSSSSSDSSVPSDVQTPGDYFNLPTTARVTGLGRSMTTSDDLIMSSRSCSLESAPSSVYPSSSATSPGTDGSMSEMSACFSEQSVLEFSDVFHTFSVDSEQEMSSEYY